MTTCKHCRRPIVSTEEGWADPLATGDDSVWRFSCDNNDTFTALHVPRRDGQRFVRYWLCFCRRIIRWSILVRRRLRNHSLKSENEGN